MDRRLKERLTGAAVLVMLAVIFIPMVLDNSNGNYTPIEHTNIPAIPDTDIRSRIIPLEAPPLTAPDAGNIPATDSSRAAIKPDTTGNEAVVQPTASPAVEPAPAKSAVPEAVDRVSSPATEKATGNIDNRGLTAWIVQLGSFSSEANAETLVRRLQDGGYPAYIEEIAGDSGSIFRVRVGPELSKADAEVTLADLNQKFAIKGIVLQYP